MYFGKYLDPRFRDNFPPASAQIGEVNLQVNLFMGNAPPSRPPGDDPPTEPQTIHLGPSIKGES